MDRGWKRELIRMLKLAGGETTLDIACGSRWAGLPNLCSNLTVSGHALRSFGHRRRDLSHRFRLCQRRSAQNRRAHPRGTYLAFAQR